mgnify:FL=1
MEHIGKALGEFIKDSKIEKGLEQNKATMIWPEVVGKKIADNTEVCSVESGVVLVKVKTPVWRQELQLQKHDIINQLNKTLTKKTIKDIRFV